MSFNIGSVSEWINWNPTTHPTGNLTSNITFTDLTVSGIIKSISTSVVLNGSGYSIIFSGINTTGKGHNTSIINVANNPSANLTVNNLILDFNGDSIGNSANSLFLGGFVQAAATITINTIKILNSQPLNLCMCGRIDGTLNINNIEIGTDDNPATGMFLASIIRTGHLNITGGSFITGRSVISNGSGTGLVSQCLSSTNATGSVTLNSCVLICKNDSSTPYTSNSGTYYIYTGHASFNNCYIYNECSGVTNFSVSYVYSLNVQDTGTVVDLFNSCYYYQSSNGSGNVILFGTLTGSTITINATDFATNTSGFIPNPNGFTTNYTNVVTDHDYTQNTTVAPFSAASFQNATYWTGGNSSSVTGAPYLTKLSTAPWNTSYTAFNDKPSLEQPLPCLVKGTIIRVQENGVIKDKPIETLKVGDTVVLGNNNKLGVIQEIFNTTIKNPTIKQLPVKIPQNSLGEGCPKKDLYLSERHLVLPLNIKEGACYEIHPAGFMRSPLDVDGAIRDDSWCGELEYYHLVLENPYDTLIANNMIVESYVK